MKRGYSFKLSFLKIKGRFRSFLKYWFPPRDKTHRGWMDLDNASTIFPSVLNSTDTKVFRFTATMSDEVDPELLQKALQQTYNHFPLYHSVIRRGFFWYYFEHSDLSPVVEKETESPCMALFHYDERQLLFRVLYYKNRIHLEVFHAISDGTGAFWFLQLLVTNYVFLRYPESSARTQNLGEVFGMPHFETDHQLDDSFARYFNQKRKISFFSIFKRKIDEDRNKYRWKKIYRIRGRRTQDNRMQIFEAEMPVKAVLELAKERKVTLSVFLTAVFIESIYRSIDKKKQDCSVTISVPINLRQFYPSYSARNFFATILIGYQFDQENYSLEDICRSVALQYDELTKIEYLEKKINSLVKLEKNFALRTVFRPLKNFVLRLANSFNNLNITVALSNMGKVSFPNAVEDYVDQIYVYTAATRPQFACITHKDILTINFSSPYQDTDIQRNFIKRLTELKVPVAIGANEVNPAEDSV